MRFVLHLRLQFVEVTTTFISTANTCINMSGDLMDLPSMEELKHLINLCRCALNLNNFLFKFYWKKVTIMRKSF